jgi:succinate dehydrogenase / fumarate reductase, cytochrome b subunit
MSWFSSFVTSSIGQKLQMAASGLFLIIFLLVHLAGNFQLLAGDGGEAFNTYSYFMTHNPVIKTVSYLLYASILWHAIQGLYLYFQNKSARNTRYAVTYARGNETTARNMAWFGTIILVFLILHMYQFWLQMKLDNVVEIKYPNADHPVKDLYSLVAVTYSNIYFVIFYVVCMAVIGMHLWHGFWSSFQTLGLAHKKYTPLIKGIGMAYSVLIPAGFALLPIYFYMFLRS